MIGESIQLGEAVEHRGVVVAPLFPHGDPHAAYLTLAEALQLGFQVTEIDETGSVTELVATNRLDRAVLLYDGEELQGAKQNRILNVTVLVTAHSETRIPVSCVEQGRWHSRTACFTAAHHTAYPDLRRQKAEQLRSDPLSRGSAQHAVWNHLAAKAARLGVHSPTGAAADIYHQRQDALATLRDAFPLEPGQSGALLALGRERLCLDYLSRPATFASLYPKLLDGYLLDALEHLEQQPASQDHLAGFLDRIAAAPQTRSASPGSGEDLRLAAPGVVGSGLLADGELLQLCAFTPTGYHAAAEDPLPARDTQARDQRRNRRAA